MYIKTTCPHCGKPSLSQAVIHYRKITECSENGITQKVVLNGLEVTDTVKAETLAYDIYLTLKSYVIDGISVDELCKMIKMVYNVAARYCCDIIEQLKIELGMYCPDRQHLYFVTA